LVAFVTAGAAESNVTLKLKDGSEIAGQVGGSTFNRDGVAIMIDGRYQARTRWDKFSQDALRQLAQFDKAKAFVAPLLEEASPEVKEQEEVKARKEARAIPIKPVENRLERPKAPSRFLALFVTPVGIVLFLLMYGGNIYAAYEIAVFKNRPVALVCTVAALVPVLGSVLFFCLPAVKIKSAEEIAAEAATAAALAEAEAPVVEAAAVEEVAAPVEEAPAAPLYPPTTAFKRGQFIFNRRFFESKFAPYFKPVLGDQEKDMFIILRTARGEFVGHRFSKAEQNEVYLQINKAGASEEVMIPFVEVNEIIIKHKDAPMP
jgi:hypothetical protein